MRMRIRNVRTYIFHHIYIYTARLINEHPREWLASLADYTICVSVVCEITWNHVNQIRACSKSVLGGKIDQ